MGGARLRQQRDTKSRDRATRAEEGKEGPGVSTTYAPYALRWKVPIVRNSAASDVPHLRTQRAVSGIIASQTAPMDYRYTYSYSVNVGIGDRLRQAIGLCLARAGLSGGRRRLCGSRLHVQLEFFRAC